MDQFADFTQNLIQWNKHQNQYNINPQYLINLVKYAAQDLYFIH